MSEEKKYRYFIHLAYNGKNYHGWQVQNNSVSVQGEINKALSLLLKSEIHVVGCGRTDTGVNASDFFAHFDTGLLLEQKKLDFLVFKLNRFLKEDIVIFSMYPVALDFHSRFDAKERTYKYYIHTRKDPFKNEFSWYNHVDLNIEDMNDACNILLGNKDFSCFSKSGTQTKTNFCNIKDAKWEKEGDHVLVFTVSADRFLRNMVRAIVGTMVEIGVGKIAVQDLNSIIESKDRGRAGYSVPGNALFLHKIEY